MKEPFPILAALVGAVSIALTACGDSSGSLPTPTLPAVSTVPAAIATSAELAWYPVTARTNIPVIDSAIIAALGGDIAALEKQVRFQTLACVAESIGPIPSPPKCTATEPPGTPVQVVLLGTGEGSYLRQADLAELFRNWLGLSRHLFAVKRLDPVDPLAVTSLAGAKYDVVFVTATGEGTTLSLSEAGIVYIGFDPSRNPRRKAAGPAGQFLLPPR